MASIYSRKNPNGEETWRVVFRRKNMPTICYTFLTEEEARTFARKSEPIYLKDPKKFETQKENIRLSGRRDRDFQRIVGKDLGV